jgi:hypothetical protein
MKLSPPTQEPLRSGACLAGTFHGSIHSCGISSPGFVRAVATRHRDVKKPGARELARIAQRLTVTDKPLTKGIVTFVPEVSKGNTTQHQPSGQIDPDGNYTLCTPKAREGVPPSWYKVTVVCRDYPPESGLQGIGLIAEKYGRAESGLAVEAVEIAEAGKNDFDLEPLSQSERQRVESVKQKKIEK